MKNLEMTKFVFEIRNWIFKGIFVYQETYIMKVLKRF